MAEHLNGDDDTNGHPVAAPVLLLDNTSHAGETLARLNTLRTEGQLCDVTLQVERQSFSAHRSVLACVSGYLMELFTEDESSGRSHFKLPLAINADAFQAILYYAYTSRLEVGEEVIARVYKTATLLKVPRVAQACSEYLAQNLTLQNCLAIRALANATCHGELTRATDAFLASNIQHLVNTEDLGLLPSCKFDIVGVTSEELLECGENHVAELVVNWLHAALQEQKFQTFTENPHVLYVTSDKKLRDCLTLEDEEARRGSSLAEQCMHEKIHSCDLVQDYVKLSRRKQIPAVKGSKVSRAVPPVTQVRRHSSLEKLNSCHEEWKLLATHMVKECTCICVAMLGDVLTMILLKFRPYPSELNKASAALEGNCTVTAAVVNGRTSPREVPVTQNGAMNGYYSGGEGEALEKAVSLAPIAPMSQGRCSTGVAAMAGHLLVVGGYERGECLGSMEGYSPVTNTWSPLPPMRSARGRFDVAQIGNRLYACGGSDGSRDLKSAEVFDWESKQWSRLPNMMHQRSSPGVTALNNKIYVVGGWSGCAGLKKCEVYDPETNLWTSIADMSVGRSQASVCTVDGRILVMGGCDAWNCTNTVEMYDPAADEWRPLPNMISHRRGAGAAVFNDQVYVVGGSDGQTSLDSVEIFDPASSVWSQGPSLTQARANVSVAVLEDRLYSVGGFSGKLFLDSVESLPRKRREWTTRAPRVHSSNSETSSAESASDMESNYENEPTNRALGNSARKKRHAMMAVAAKNDVNHNQTRTILNGEDENNMQNKVEMPNGEKCDEEKATNQSKEWNHVTVNGAALAQNEDGSDSSDTLDEQEDTVRLVCGKECQQGPSIIDFFGDHMGTKTNSNFEAQPLFKDGQGESASNECEGHGDVTTNGDV